MKEFMKLIHAKICLNLQLEKTFAHLFLFGLGPPIIPIYAHPGKSGNKIFNPGIPGWFRDLRSLNKAMVNFPQKSNCSKWFLL